MLRQCMRLLLLFALGLHILLCIADSDPDKGKGRSKRQLGGFSFFNRRPQFGQSFPASPGAPGQAQKFEKGPDGVYRPVGTSGQGVPASGGFGGPSGQLTADQQTLSTQLSWINQLTNDFKQVSLPNLPGTPAVSSDTRHGGSESRAVQYQLGIGKPNEPHQPCYAPYYGPGHCRHLQYCILPAFSNNFNIFLQFVCFIDTVYVGACCPDYLFPGSTQAPTTPPTTTTTTLRPTTPPDPRGCGLSGKSGNRIVGGAPADPQEWPWMAALLKGGTSQYCGGVLITDKHVLTAAHCIHGFDTSNLYVRLGEYTFNQDGDSSHKDFHVVATKMHENYDTKTQVNDIALLTLASPTSFNADIWPICLPPPDQDYVGRHAIVTGWGTIYYGGPSSTTLQEVLIPVWTNQECKAAYPDHTVVDVNLCAGSKTGGLDSCQGDSGGPLQVQISNDGRWGVIGIVSWGIKCAEPNKPGVYTRVSKYIDWIQSNAV